MSNQTTMAVTKAELEEAVIEFNQHSDRLPTAEKLLPVLEQFLTNRGPGAPGAQPRWRCFHCEEAFVEEDDARLHFGSSELHSPACQIDIAAFRAMERRMESYNAEDSEMHRQISRMQADHSLALIREEEKGYARGLEDAKKHPEELGLCAIVTNPAGASAVAPS